MSPTRNSLLKENNVPKNNTEINILNKHMKKLEVNTRRQLDVLTTGFKELNEILRVILDSNINKEQIFKISQNIDELENNKCNHEVITIEALIPKSTEKVENNDLNNKIPKVSTSKQILPPSTT